MGFEDNGNARGRQLVGCAPRGIYVPTNGNSANECIFSNTYKIKEEVQR